MAGCGKTSLAVKAAEELATQFPDGILFIDLHGFTEGLSPANPSDVLGQALRSLGLPGQAIPETVDERSALYRSTLAGQRVLVVLDNAATAQQVLPLLPGKASSAVIVTSRARLLGIPGARTVTLAPLETAEARALFLDLVGEVDDDPAIDELVRLCGNLPLAIEMAAARTLAEQPTAQGTGPEPHRSGQLRSRCCLRVVVPAARGGPSAGLQADEPQSRAKTGRVRRRGRRPAARPNGTNDSR